MTGPEYKNVVLDAHWYLGFGPGDRTELDLLTEVLKDDVKKLRDMSRSHPVVIGEWCLSHNLPKEEMTPVQQELSYRLLADAQLTAWEECAGYFFWSYKLLSHIPSWDFRKCVERGWLPRKL